MVGSHLLALIAAVAAGVAAFLVVVLLADVLRERGRILRLQRGAGVGGPVRRILAEGAPPLRLPAAALLRCGFAARVFERLEAVLRLRSLECSAQSLASLYVAAASALLCACAVLRSPLAGAALAVCLFTALSAWSSHVLDKHRASIREALPDAVRAMGSCFHAGFTLHQTFAQLELELNGPVAELFGRAKDAMDTGSSAVEALDRIRSAGTVPELSFIAVALEVQHRAGGSMRHVLETACESLENEIEMQRSLRVHTAQARLSARVVTGVTVALVAALSLMTDDFLGPFFSGPMGFGLLALALIMQVAGVVIVQRMLKVEVD